MPDSFSRIRTHPENRLAAAKPKPPLRLIRIGQPQLHQLPDLAGGGRHPAPGRARDHSGSHEERLAHLLDRGGLFTHGDRECRHPDWSPAEPADQGAEDRPVQTVETEFVDVVHGERSAGGLLLS